MSSTTGITATPCMDKILSCSLGVVLCVVYIVDLRYRVRSETLESTACPDWLWRWQQNAFVAAISILSVAICEVLVDLLYLPSSKRAQYLSAPKIFVLTMTFCINCYIIHESARLKDIFDICRLQNLQAFCLMNCCISLMCPNMRNRILSGVLIVMQIFIVLSDILLSRNDLELEFNSELGISSFMFALATILMFLYFLRVFYIQYARHSTEEFRLPCGESLLQLICILILIALFSFRIVLTSLYFDQEPGQRSLGLVLGYTYLISISTVVISMAHGRIYRGPENERSEVG